MVFDPRNNTARRRFGLDTPDLDRSMHTQSVSNLAYHCSSVSKTCNVFYFRAWGIDRPIVCLLSEYLNELNTEWNVSVDDVPKFTGENKNMSIRKKTKFYCFILTMKYQKIVLSQKPLRAWRQQLTKVSSQSDEWYRNLC